MKKFLIFGTDLTTHKILGELFGDKNTLIDCGCIGFIDDAIKSNMFWGMPVYSPRDSRELSFDKIIILNSGNYGLQRNELIYGYRIPEKKISSANYLLNIRIIRDNKNSEEEDVKQTVENLQNMQDFDLWCGYCPKERERYEVKWEEMTNMPYVIFEGKKMFFPREYRKFVEENGKLYVKGLEFEQQEGSPHTYITEMTHVKEGDVVVDAGVCEGNFSIKYVDIISKLYLVEANPTWIYPLTLTFRDYMNKVIICNKFLEDHNDQKSITLDALTKGDRVDFLKMDIEGAEIRALRGGKDCFTSNNVSCSICAYHRHDDEKNIRSIMQEYGYRTGTSHGHMIFPYDKERFKYHELRKGVVYAWKEKSI